jgi:hypothetical protein
VRGISKSLLDYANSSSNAFASFRSRVPNLRFHDLNKLLPISTLSSSVVHG